MSHLKNKPYHQCTAINYADTFARKSFLQLFPQQIVVLLKKATIYVYNTEKEYLLHPETPAKFFNLHHADIILKDRWVIIKDRSCAQTFTYLHKQSELERFIKACKDSKSKTDLQTLFPKKFKEISKKISEDQEKTQLQSSTQFQNFKVAKSFKRPNSSRH